MTWWTRCHTASKKMYMYMRQSFCHYGWIKSDKTTGNKSNVYQSEQNELPGKLEHLFMPWCTCEYMSVYIMVQNTYTVHVQYDCSLFAFTLPLEVGGGAHGFWCTRMYYSLLFRFTCVHFAARSWGWSTRPLMYVLILCINFPDG